MKHTRIPCKQNDKMLQVITQAGNVIKVGRNAKENDALTFEHASSKDLWFHVRDFPGSHVVLSGTNITQACMLKAATVAAVNSKAREKTSAWVEYCRVLDVEKPKGAPAGMVVISHATQIEVTLKQR